VPVLAQTQGPFQHRDGALQLPLAQRHHTGPPARQNQAEGIMDGLGDPEPFLGHGEPLREHTAFGVAEAQESPGGCRDDVN
jgi:hypothetical protein